MAFEDNDQPASSYRLPVGGASADILTNIDYWISSNSSGKHSKMVSKLLPYPEVHSRHFYRSEGEEAAKNRSLSHHVTELAGLYSFDNLSRTDVLLSSFKTEDMEAAMQSIAEATSWMDWWTFTIKSLALQSSSDTCLISYLSLAGTRYQLLVAKTALTPSANLVLKRRDTVLAKVKDSISFESFMDFSNARLSSSTKLFPADILEKVVGRSSKALHGEATRKAMVQEKPQHKDKKLHFL